MKTDDPGCEFPTPEDERCGKGVAAAVDFPTFYQNLRLAKDYRMRLCQEHVDGSVGQSVRFLFP